MDNFEQQSTSGTDTVASTIDFSSLYSAIQHDYEGSNISNIITQLLRMYQPKDGINAYERVLRKVQALLEDSDFQKKQLLLSMIPSPDNVPDHTIKKVFRTTTGFIKLNQQENNTCQNIFGTKNMDQVTDISLPKQNFLCDKNTSNFKSSLSEAFPFRGFSQSEISMIPSYIKNNSSSYYLNNNSKNELERNNKHQMLPYQQYLLDKKYYIPAGINMYNTSAESHLCHSSQMDTRSMKMYNNTEIIENLSQNKIPRQFNDVKYKKYEDALDIDKKPGVSHMIIDIGQNATTTQTIKDDIHKTNVCWDEDQDIIINADDLLPTPNDRLKTSLSNFLKRAQEGISIELSAFPRIRSHPQVGSLNLVRFTPKDLKSGTPPKVLRQTCTSNVTNSDSNSCLLLKQQNTVINVEKNQKESIKRTKQKVYDNGLQKKYTSQEFNKRTRKNELQIQQNNLHYDMEKKEGCTFVCKEKNTEKSRHGCKVVDSNSDNVNSANNFQARSMFQLAAYKKRYYDTLLNVQRAKVAISNSLASPSDHLIAYDDPYYSNYICQQQHLLHQQCHLPTRPEFSRYPADLSGLSSVHCDQYSWTKSICKYLLLKQLRLQRQVRRYRETGWIHRYVGHVYPYSSMPSGSDQTKYCVRRKNLEDIVGKLKVTERNDLDLNN
ncbi:PREDICTED: uncharacterized protein LOC105455749 isoform X2 [Wasmannia auropunctata]|uniref:uncharacterized protein LOC105455749 isoform X2 n=1 Tax=Wasmannia auropunctata TaxID=64793 RepID=UPI0005EFA0E0|nr:PREDICTED: uncharacterized protein LOC105455749 isoform X2 [Wasmannia auropunctata]